MSVAKVLGLALGASLLFGLPQIAVASPTETSNGATETPAAQDNLVPATYSGRRTTGNIYGSHGVIGHNDAVQHGPVGHASPVRRGYYGAARPRYHAHRYYGPHYARRYYSPRSVVAGGYYGAARYRPYRQGYYAPLPLISLGDYAATDNRYYGQGYYSSSAVAGSAYYGAAGYRPDYYSHRYYPRPSAYYGASGYSPYNSQGYYPTRAEYPGYYRPAGYRRHYYAPGYYAPRPAEGAPVFYNNPISAISGR